MEKYGVARENFPPSVLKKKKKRKKGVEKTSSASNPAITMFRDIDEASNK